MSIGNKETNIKTIVELCVSLEILRREDLQSSKFDIFSLTYM